MCGQDVESAIVIDRLMGRKKKVQCGSCKMVVTS